MRTKITALAALAVSLLSCIHDGADRQSTVAPSPIPLVVDTDAGLDDAIALLYLARSPEVDLLAVTVTGTGLAHCFPGARNVIGLLELAGRGDVPVACGPETPLGKAGAAFPDEWRRMADTRYGDAWTIGGSPLDDREAPELLVDAVDRASDPVRLLTLGPLTNVAAALELDDRFAGGIDHVVTMGGAFDVPGNTAFAEPPPEHDVAEWNIYADPVAARGSCTPVCRSRSSRSTRPTTSLSTLTSCAPSPSRPRPRPS